MSDFCHYEGCAVCNPSDRARIERLEELLRRAQPYVVSSNAAARVLWRDIEQALAPQAAESFHDVESLPGLGPTDEQLEKWERENRRRKR